MVTCEKLKAQVSESTCRARQIKIQKNKDSMAQWGHRGFFSGHNKYISCIDCETGIKILNKKEYKTMESKSTFLTREEAANYLNLKRCTLEAWTYKGIGPAFVKFGRSVRYRVSDLEAFIDGATRQTGRQ